MSNLCALDSTCRWSWETRATLCGQHVSGVLGISPQERQKSGVQSLPRRSDFRRCVFRSSSGDSILWRLAQAQKYAGSIIHRVILREGRPRVGEELRRRRERRSMQFHQAVSSSFTQLSNLLASGREGSSVRYTYILCFHTYLIRLRRMAYLESEACVQ